MSVKELEPVSAYIAERKREMRSCVRQAKENLAQARVNHARINSQVTRFTLVRALANHEIASAFADTLETIR